MGVNRRDLMLMGFALAVALGAAGAIATRARYRRPPTARWMPAEIRPQRPVRIRIRVRRGTRLERLISRYRPSGYATLPSSYETRIRQPHPVNLDDQNQPDLSTGFRL